MVTVAVQSPDWIPLITSSPLSERGFLIFFQIAARSAYFDLKYGLSADFSITSQAP